MKKKVAVIVPEPVNGFGLFAYLEAFYESDIDATTYAVSSKPEVQTNSGVSIKTNGLIKDLKGKEANYDGVVFACGDVIIKLGELMATQEYKDMLEVVQNFDKLEKKIAGHCAAGLIFEQAGVTTGKKIAVHPLGKCTIKAGIAVDNSSIVDKNLYTARDENNVMEVIPWFIRFL